MIDGRIILVIAPVIILWCTMISGHRATIFKSDKVTVGRIIATLAGSRTRQVDRRTFGLQLGDLSIILWYIILRFSGIEYFVENAYVFAVLSGAITGLILQRILKLFSVVA